MSGNSGTEDETFSNDNATFGRGKEERAASPDPTSTPAFGFPVVLADAISAAMNPAASEPAAQESPLSNAPGASRPAPSRENSVPDFGQASAPSAPSTPARAASAPSAQPAPNSTPSSTPTPTYEPTPRKKRGLFDRLTKGVRGSSRTTQPEEFEESVASAPVAPTYPEPMRSEVERPKPNNKQPKPQNNQASVAPSNTNPQKAKKKNGKQAAANDQAAPKKQNNQQKQAPKKSKTADVDFLWEAPEEKRSAKGNPDNTTVVESDTDYLLLPHPDVFNAYPPEVQRKIMQWADRDVRARRDDESLRQDALVRARTARERTQVTVPVTIIVLCIICATITGVVTRSAIFPVSFLVVALAVIISIYFTRKNDLYAFSQQPQDDEEEDE